jgi:hypothetical protein
VAEAYDVREGDPPIGLEVVGGGGGAPLTRRRGRRSGRHRAPLEKSFPGGGRRGGAECVGREVAVGMTEGRRIWAGPFTYQLWFW